MRKARAIEKETANNEDQLEKNSKNSTSTTSKLLKSQSPDPAKHYGLTRVLDAPVTLANAEGKDFVFQYDVKFADGLTCGGEEEEGVVLF